MYCKSLQPALKRRGKGKEVRRERGREGEKREGEKRERERRERGRERE